VSKVESAGWRIALAASRLAFFGGLCLLVMAAFPILPVFVAGSVLSMAASGAAIPLMTQIYQENYPDLERGKLFSRTLMIRIGVAALFSQLAGDFLTRHPGEFRGLLLVFAGCFFFGSFCMSRCPSTQLKSAGGTHPFRALRHAREDRLFRWTLISWMFMGFANLMMIPMRVEYLANPKYNLNLSVTEIAVLVGVVPNVARLIMSPIWGGLFDRMNFFALRATLNFGFAIGIISFFTSDQLPGLIIGAVIFGISNAGGDVAWGLWVTKFAPPDRVADYMSVHLFFTGVRGVLAPVTAFHLVSGAHALPMVTLGWISAGLIFISAAMLLSEVKFGKLARPGNTVIEDVSD
jgi:hypothetical protein